jgi:hypothetical protein
MVYHPKNKSKLTPKYQETYRVETAGIDECGGAEHAFVVLAFGLFQ